MHKAQKKMTVS